MPYHQSIKLTLFANDVVFCSVHDLLALYLCHIVNGIIFLVFSTFINKTFPRYLCIAGLAKLLTEDLISGDFWAPTNGSQYRCCWGCTNQQPPQRGGAVPGPVWVGSKWLLAFPRVPVTPSTPHSFFRYAAP